MPSSSRHPQNKKVVDTFTKKKKKQPQVTQRKTEGPEMATASISDTTAPLYTTARAHSTTAYSRRQNPSKESSQFTSDAGAISAEAAKPAPSQLADKPGSEQTSSVREGKRPDVGNPYPVFRYDRTLSEEGLLGAHVWTGGFRSICVDFMGYLIADEEGSAYAQKIRAARVIGYDTMSRAILGPVGTICFPTPGFVEHLFNNVDFVTELNSLNADSGGYDEGTDEYDYITRCMDILRVHQNWLSRRGNAHPDTGLLA